MATTPEGKVKAAVKKRLKEMGVWFCMPMGTGFGNSGVPDFVCCWGGQFLAIETKAPGKRSNTTSMQDNQIAGIRKAGGTAVVIDDVSQLDSILGAPDANQA